MVFLELVFVVNFSKKNSFHDGRLQLRCHRIDGRDLSDHRDRESPEDSVNPREGKTFPARLLGRLHGVPVKGAAHLFFGQFIILIADETATGVSGCSTDSSVRLIKQIEKNFGVNMFDRTTLAFVVTDKSGEDRIQLLPLAQIQFAIDHGFISANTLYFNNLVQSKEELENKWIIPLRDSWLAKRISFANSVS